MKKKSDKKYVFITIIVLAFMIGGYALFTMAYKTIGHVELRAIEWNIGFILDSIKVKEGSVLIDEDLGDVGVTVTDNTSVSFNVFLQEPGDFYEFTIDLKNTGSVNAMISSIEKTPILTEEQEKYMNYSITYDNDEEIKIKDGLKAFQVATIKVRVEYKKDIIDNYLPEEVTPLNFKLKINYEKADEEVNDINYPINRKEGQ